MTSYLKMRGEPLNVSQSHLGQVWDDYYLDQELAKTLVQLQPFPPAARVVMLTSVVRENPDSTAAAVSLMVSLRQCDAFRVLSTTQGRAIPKMITQFWDSEKPPEDIAKIMESWPAQNQNYTIQRFNDAGAQAWLARHCSDTVLLAYRRASEPAKKADIFRLAFLTIEGGVYADADDRCIKPLETIIPESAELVLWHESFGTIGNNFIAAAPDHPVIRRALDLVVTSVNRGDSDILWLSTGPGPMTRALSQVLVERGSVILPRTVVLDQSDLSKAVAIHCSAGYKVTKKHWLNSAFAKQERAVRPKVISE
jgi:mannosyltransferase OCH1-like enzyme